MEQCRKHNLIKKLKNSTVHLSQKQTIIKIKFQCQTQRRIVFTGHAGKGI
jgi:hypothetical protein